MSAQCAFESYPTPAGVQDMCTPTGGVATAVVAVTAAITGGGSFEVPPFPFPKYPCCMYLNEHVWLPFSSTMPAGPVRLSMTSFLILATGAANTPELDGCTLTERQWTQHCMFAEDCTSDEGFCDCCRAHPGTEWAEACSVICPETQTDADESPVKPGLRFADFGLGSSDGGDINGNSLDEVADDTPADGTGPDLGPLFDQPALSLVGDAAVVLGDCYHLDVRASERRWDGGQDACLVPPVPRRSFPSDSHLSINLTICPSRVAPFHMHDTQPAVIPAMLCFDECRVRNLTQPPEPPPVVDYDSLRIANCTRMCLGSCTRPLAADCAIGCSLTNYTCFAECHLRARTCSVPTVQRDLRYFREDPNIAVCTDEYAGFEQCVSDCNSDCHEALRLSKRTAEDDINDWYNATCSPPLDEAVIGVSSCSLACQANCTHLCNETVTQVLGPALGLGPALSNCTRNCTAGCNEVCFTDEKYYEYEAGCRPPTPYNCTGNCFDAICSVAVTYCTVYDVDGRLRHVDSNCTIGSNVSFSTSWANKTVESQLAEPLSPLSLLLGVNATRHVCYNFCDEASESNGADFFFHGSVLKVGRNCTSFCYEHVCIDSCLSNCTLEAEMRMLPPCTPGPDCLSPTDCIVADQYGNCSAVKAFEPVMINITAITENATVRAPPWDQDVCESLVGLAADSFRACVELCPQTCEVMCPLPPNVSTLLVDGVLYNDTSGVCLQACHFECTENCTSVSISSVKDTWCLPPSEPIEHCVPPPNCTAACANECYDPTLLLMTDPDCKEYLYRKTPDGDNLTVISIPYWFNISGPPQCSRNLSVADCPTELLYHNVTEHQRDILVSEGCVRRCAARCIDRCFDRYCVTRIEVPVNETATCLPRCLKRFFEEDMEYEAMSVDGADANATVVNVTQCQLTCHDECIASSVGNCSAICEPIIDPSAWQACYAGCYANVSVACGRDCVYQCTANHTLAYGFPRAYDASGDYLTADELREYGLDESVDFSQLGQYSHEWGNTSEACYANCTYHRADACFTDSGVSTACDEEAAQVASERVVLGLPKAHPREIAWAMNNCTLRRAAPCLDASQVGCMRHCANRTDPVQHDVIEAQEAAALYDLYVESCEAKCRLQIYGRNVTLEERCIDYTPTFRLDCLENCSNAVRASCANPNITIDVVRHCNSTCIHLYIDPDSLIDANATASALEADAEANRLSTALLPPEDLNVAYDECMSTCHGNFTLDSSYLCDGGALRAVSVAVAEEYYTNAMGGLGTQGITPSEQMEIDRLFAAVPAGEVCKVVNLGCVANNTFGCEDQCAESVAYYHELCVYRDTVRRNATFEYNISSCIAPDGWRLGTEKWRFYAAINASSELAQPRYHRPNSIWSFDDVEDAAILNCTCHFLNETFDPHFVAALIEYDMRPYRSHYVSTCLCLYNATAGEPQHCVHSNFSNIMNIFDWVFGNRSMVTETEDLVVVTADNNVARGTPCILHCVSSCGAYFVEHVPPSTNNGSMYLHRLNTTFRYTGFPSSLTDWNVSNVVTPGHWRAKPGCFEPCMVECAVTNVSSGCERECAGSREDNSTAIAFGCFWNSTADEGRPLCGQFCDCHSECATRCVHELGMLNTSTEMLLHLPFCLGNCSSACQDAHHERCYNISLMLAAARRPKYVNRTAVCLTRIWPTCALHCLGASVRNTTVNNSLFLPSKLPAELLELNVTAGFDPNAAEGYECTIEPCDVGMECNQTALQIGERKVYDPVSGNTSIVPILMNVTTASIEGCYANRSSACLETCSEFGYLVCVPEIDPFDLCVQSCVANLTYVEDPYEFDHSLAVCKKKLRLTSSQSSRRGAAWYRRKQYVREGFRSSFAFRLEHASKRCQTVAHPSHERRPENADMHCEGRGGDGFAFVLQDSGDTAFDASCTYGVVEGCIDGEAAVCMHRCRSLCPGRGASQHATCAATCLSGAPYIAPAVASLHGGAAHFLAAAQAAGDACEAHVGACVGACDSRLDELHSGAAMGAGGCLRTCLDAGAQSYCEARCPLVDEDIDQECIDACAIARSEGSSACYVGCNASCAMQAAVEEAACENECHTTEALLPSGDTVGRCRNSALAHSAHESALCLTGCRHHDETCLRGCAESPPNALPNCVASCPQNDTLCVEQCLEGRRQLGDSCIYPNLIRTCKYSSVALGNGDSGVGYASMRNTLAVKFDTWYNSEDADPWVSHVAVHSGGEDHGAPSHSSKALGVAYDFADLADDRYHEVVIEYMPSFDLGEGSTTLSMSPGIAAQLTSAQRGNMRYTGMLHVHLDGRLVLRVPLNLETLLRLEDGSAFVGFTGATGAAYQEHSIMAWQFNQSSGKAFYPTNEHCRYRVPSLWQSTAFSSAPLLPANTALACTPDVVNPATPTGAMHGLRCTEDPLDPSIMYCADPYMCRRLQPTTTRPLCSHCSRCSGSPVSCSSATMGRNMRNVAPYVAVPLPDITILVGQPFAWVLPPDAFLDRQSDGRLSSKQLHYSLNHEMAWLQFDATERRLHGTPTHAGTWPITVTATDPGFREGADPPLSVSDVFLCHVHEAPVATTDDVWVQRAS